MGSLERKFQRKAMKEAMKSVQYDTSWGEWTVKTDLTTDFFGGPISVKPPANAVAFAANKVYWVVECRRTTDIGEVRHLMISRIDGRALHNWYDAFRIKNELVGTDVTAVEVYPAIEDLVDDKNVYHLWCLPPGMKLAFGLHKESVDVNP
jgi:hypothetical protein